MRRKRARIYDIMSIINYENFQYFKFVYIRNIFYSEKLHYDFCFWRLSTLRDCGWKLTQIVRFSEKSLLCNVSMKYVSGRLSLMGGLSYFSGHAFATLRYATLHSTLKNKVQVVASASALWNTWIPPWGEYGKTRSSNIETAKHLDFAKTVERQVNFQARSPRDFKNLYGKNHFQTLLT